MFAIGSWKHLCVATMAKLERNPASGDACKMREDASLGNWMLKKRTFVGKGTPEKDTDDVLRKKNSSLHRGHSEAQDLKPRNQNTAQLRL